MFKIKDASIRKLNRKEQKHISQNPSCNSKKKKKKRKIKTHNTILKKNIFDKMETNLELI